MMAWKVDERIPEEMFVNLIEKFDLKKPTLSKTILKIV